jgi:hypothetical protein
MDQRAGAFESRSEMWSIVRSESEAEKTGETQSSSLAWTRLHCIIKRLHGWSHRRWEIGCPPLPRFLLAKVSTTPWAQIHWKAGVLAAIGHEGALCIIRRDKRERRGGRPPATSVHGSVGNDAFESLSSEGIPAEQFISGGPACSLHLMTAPSAESVRSTLHAPSGPFRPRLSIRCRGDDDMPRSQRHRVGTTLLESKLYSVASGPAVQAVRRR